MKKVLTMILSLTLLISMTACQAQKPAEIHAGNLQRTGPGIRRHGNRHDHH